MGFDSVYRSLIELFPQIDQRLLRAVAIEHSKDADAAVESVILEIIPYWSQRRFAAFSPPKDVRPVGTSDGLDTGFAVESEAEHEEQSKLLRRRTVGAESDVSTSSGVPLMTEQAYDNDVTLSAHLTGSTNDEALITSAIEAEREEQSKLLSQMVDGEKEVGSSSGVTSVTRQVYDYESDGSTGAHLTGSTNDETLVASTTILNFYDSCYGKSITSTGEELILLEGARENSHQFGLVDEANNLTNEGGDNVTVSPELPSNLVQDKAGVSDNLIDLHHEWKDFEGPCADDFEMISCSKLDQTKSCLDGSPVEGKCSLVEVVPSSPQENTIDTICGSPHVDIDTSASTDDFEKLEAGGSIDLNRNDEFPIVQKEDMDDDANIIITRSGQICRVDLLEEIIEVSKNHKKTLFAAMESVMNMVREVELQEKAAETAELEAARGGLDILVEVEKLKTMLGHAKETNDMHAGEVYGEKAILATELRELQNRLLSLSDERDKSLAILDEMHQSLEARLAVAEKLKKAAEQEKLEKEESARNALAEQEAIMDMVVQDSKILQQEAEENSKLQEFLVDRGHIVDALQGEISVICQDVRLLKENFDGRVPLSKSVSSSQTSCILASSGSSVKSMALDLLSEKNGTSKSSLKGSQTPTDAQSSGSRHEVETNSMDAQSPGSRDEEEITSPGRIALLDDGWDIFEKDAELQQGK